MSVSDEQIAFALDLFAGLGPLTTRKMMGGLCIYRDGVIFALLHSDGQIYLKGAGDFPARLEAMGSTRWTYTREKDGKVIGMPYWTLPSEAEDDPELAAELARKALSRL